MELDVLSTDRQEPTIRNDQIREDTPTATLIPWIVDRFGRQRLVLTTQFGMEGCALIHMFSLYARHLTVVYIDTAFFFAETYQLRDRLIQKYPHISFANCGTAMTPEQQAAEHGPELWKSNPALCCVLRKVEPMREVMQDVDVWVTGLRRDQSKTREHIRIIDWDWQYRVLKVNPLANWTREQIWDYVQKHNVPYNALHEKGYPTLGCTHCTQRVEGAGVTDYSRDGRWSAFDKTECGLHGAGI
ncbi:MAG: phosphoadenylyl-sulfate reductase [Phycisphaerales bacterium]|nr:phosphoadenylyl-sulfate reductase [Phycisphaerales bacterium]MCB9862417.1 phosphoadenylyl-sulfate reductase [Phycisphaerales bacterium]